MDRRTWLMLCASIVIAAIIIAAGRFMGTGRYQMTAANQDGNVLLLDTRTGRTWMKFVPRQGGPVEWQETDKPR